MRPAKGVTFAGLTAPPFPPRPSHDRLLDQAQHRPSGLALQAIAMKARLWFVLKRLDATLQLGSPLGVRSHSRTHRQRISLL